MNLLLQSLASEEWASVVKALLHTLWIGGLAAGGLYVVLRGKTDPVRRHHWCAGALLAVVLGGIVAWAILERRPTATASTPLTQIRNPESEDHNSIAPPGINSAPFTAIRNPQSAMRNTEWIPWLALLWLGGAGVMLARAGSLVMQAEKLRRSGSPLANEAVLKLIEEARRRLGLARRIQVVVTEQLTSPAVMGLLTPVLILPLSIVTTLPMSQLQLILLHELAHVRRGDYLVNLCQLLAESLLFFNPAVWWISRQIRQEREACCDAVAIALAGERLQYAQALANAAAGALAAAPAFGDRRNPSGLKDRIQRLLVPGYRPALRLTWCALLAALFVGGGLLFLSALGTRVAVAAILSPQERIARIEKKMTEIGENPGAAAFNGHFEKMPKVTVSGRVRMADGTAVPKWVQMNVVSVVKNSSYGSGIMSRDGLFTNSIPAGTIIIGSETTNYAPAQIGPLDGLATNRFENLELVFSPGFDATIQLVDADSGKPVAGGTLGARFWLRGASQTSFYGRALTTDEKGVAVLTHAADLPLVVSAKAPGYEILDQRFESVKPDKPLRIPLRAGAKVSGVVLDKTSGQPIAGATVGVRFQRGPTTMGYEWGDTLRILATTDENGRFAANQLRTDTVYWLGVSAPGHESAVLNSVRAGNVLEARLGPEIIVKGRITGNLDLLDAAWDRKGGKEIAYTIYDDTAENHNDYSHRAPVRIVDGSGYFQFTNQAAGRVAISPPGQTEERTVTGPIDDWLIDLNKSAKPPAKDLPKREVVFRFKDRSGVSARGTVSVTIQNNSEKLLHTAHEVEMQITNGEVRAQIEIGGNTAIEAKSMVGFWFDHWKLGKNGGMFIEVTNGAGPQVVEIPLLPAGAIYAKARNADGTPAGGLMFGVSVLKRASGMAQYESLGGSSDGFSGDAPRKWVSGALPLGGTYQIHAWRGNSFCVSKPIKLTEANPDAEIELQFPAGKTFDGVVLDPDGKPLQNAELTVSFLFELPDGGSFGLQSVFTDERGRFRIENMTPELGEYTVQADAPGAMAESAKLDFGSQPQTLRLKRGRTLAGRVVQAGTGYAIPDTEVRALDYDREKLPTLTTRTDADGRFAFKTLGDVNYTLYVEGVQLLSDKKYRADGSTNVVLSVKIDEGSQVKPKAPKAD